MTDTLNHNTEPTPQFDQACVELVRRWEVGDLPFNDAIVLLTQYEQDAQATRHLANQARAQHLLGYLQHFRGNLNASIHHYEKARNIFMKVGNARRVATMDLNNGENYRLKGDFARARRLYRAAYEAARQLNYTTVQTMAAVNEGLALLAAGQYGSAYELLMEGYELTQEWTDRLDALPGLRCEINHALTSIYLHQGKPQHAWEAAHRAYDDARSSGDGKLNGFAYRALGEAITALGQAPEGFSDDPDEYFRLSLTVFRDLNMEAEMARTIFAQARSLALRGRRTTAARKLQQVMIMFTELGMMDDTAKAAEAQLAVI